MKKKQGEVAALSHHWGKVDATLFGRFPSLLKASAQHRLDNTTATKVLLPFVKGHPGSEGCRPQKGLHPPTRAPATNRTKREKMLADNPRYVTECNKFPRDSRLATFRRVRDFDIKIIGESKIP